ncbi:hypothetical protein BKA66DRAFT_443284 [Pyrenochaeta sp. MPI-SDFR-AT-0127]|nr:hypothetical protein BKA66DRAFT_443284 [Pyrenochaeta sp. MPI-SDFR-AT-0127]
MKSSASIVGAIFCAIGMSSAQSATSVLSPTTTIVVTPGCPSAPSADVIVTRSLVAVPSCAADDSTKPSIISVPGYGANGTTPSGTGGGSSTTTGTGGLPQFTGAAASNGAKSMVMVIAGVVAGFLM